MKIRPFVVRLVFSAGFAATFLMGEKTNAQLPVIHRIKLVHVDSDVIEAVGYHHKTRTLELHFRSGAVYRYARVPAAIFDELMAADSKGRCFRERVRGRYDYWRVE